MKNIDQTDILIVGAGPIGLSMAIQLRSKGFTNFRIVEKGPEPGEEMLTSISRAIGIHARTVEILEDLGISEKLIQRGTIAHTASNFYNSNLTYRVNYPAGCDNTHVRYPWNLMVTQGNTIDVLYKHLSKELSGVVEWDKPLIDLSQDDNGATATVINSTTGEKETINAQYVVGCDGCHSVVRKELDIGFPGHSYPVKWVVCDLDIEWDIPHDDITFLSVKDAYAIALPLAGGGNDRFRVTMAKPLTQKDLSDPTDHAAPMVDEPFTSEDCVNFLKHIYPSAKIKSAPSEPKSWFQIHCRFAEKFRDNRCFLVGDAAHIHSPILGQGMNMGIQDATNLAWKLASVCKGNSPEALLNSYEEERVYADKEVVYFVDKITKLVITRSKIFQYLRGFILKNVLKTLRGRRKLISKVMQLSIHYKGSNSSLIDESWDYKEGGIATGERTPDPNYNKGDTEKPHLFQSINGNHWNSLIFVGENATDQTIEKALIEAEKIKNEYRDMVESYIVVREQWQKDRCKEISTLQDNDGILHQVFSAKTTCIYLLRPDRYVGYRNNKLDDNTDTYLKNIFYKKKKSIDQQPLIDSTIAEETVYG